MRYPKKLVEQNGAKAGILMYVENELPDIPQRRMIVKSLDESIDNFLERADASSISYPRLFRSSAIQELWGFEGDFLTELVENFETQKETVFKYSQV